MPFRRSVSQLDDGVSVSVRFQSVPRSHIFHHLRKFTLLPQRCTLHRRHEISISSVALITDAPSNQEASTSNAIMSTSSYAQTPLGLLNMAQLIMGPIIYFFVSISYSTSRMVVLRLDSLFMVWVAGAFFIMSLFLMTCGMLDPNIPLGRVYRTMEAWGAMYYVMSSLIFTFQETYLGTTQMGRLAVAIAIFNCFSYVASTVIAFQPVIV